MSLPNVSADNSALPTAGIRPERVDILPASPAEAMRAAIRNSQVVNSKAQFKKLDTPSLKRERRDTSAVLNVHGFTVSAAANEAANKQPVPSSSGSRWQGAIKEEEREEGGEF